MFQLVRFVFHIIIVSITCWFLTISRVRREHMKHVFIHPRVIATQDDRWIIVNVADCKPKTAYVTKVDG